MEGKYIVLFPVPCHRQRGVKDVKGYKDMKLVLFYFLFVACPNHSDC
jgi:hypothetical protein